MTKGRSFPARNHVVHIDADGRRRTEKVRKCDYCGKKIGVKGFEFHVRIQHPGTALANLYRSLP